MDAADGVECDATEPVRSTKSGRRFHLPSLRRFRLSSLLLLVAVVAVWLSLRYTRQDLSTSNLGELRLREQIDANIWKVRWNRDGSRVALVGWEQPVQVHDGVTLWKLKTIGDQKKIIHFAFSPDPNVVAWCENSGRPVIEHLDSGFRLGLEGERGQWKLEFSPDGRILAGGRYGAVRLWDVASGNLIRQLDLGTIPGGTRPVFSPDGLTLAVGNRNGDTPIFDVATGEVRVRLTKTMSQELRFHPTRPVIAVGYVDASVALWDTISGERLRLVQTEAEEIYTLDWSSDGRMLVAAGLRGNIELFNGSDLTLIHRLEAPEWVISARFRPDEKGLFIAGGDQSGTGKRWVQEWIVPSTLQKWLLGP